MISFRLAPHGQLPDVTITEILVDGKVAGAIYPDGSNGIRVVSAHFKGIDTEEGFTKHVVLDNGRQTNPPMPPIPNVSIQLYPRPYKIADGKIVPL